MILDARSKEKPAGVLVDLGTGLRIPFARKVDFERGTYEHLVPAPNGVDVLVDEYGKPLVRQGRAVGRLELVPLDKAATIGAAPPPQKVYSPIEPLSADQKIDGLEQYKRVYVEVWQWRGESRKCADERFHAEFLRKNSFLDAFVIRRKVVPTT